MTEDRILHLRIVATSDDFIKGRSPNSSKVPKLVQKEAEQLQLPYLDSLTLILAFVQSFRALSDFSEFLAEMKPRWVFDVRIIPRLDVFGGGRSHAFSVFRKSNIKYIDLFGQLGVQAGESAGAKPDYWGRKIGEMIEQSETSKGVVILLFDNIKLLNNSATVLPAVLRSALRS